MALATWFATILDELDEDAVEGPAAVEDLETSPPPASTVNSPQRTSLDH
jgi:hypothetical protein